MVGNDKSSFYIHNLFLLPQKWFRNRRDRGIESKTRIETEDVSLTSPPGNTVPCVIGSVSSLTSGNTVSLSSSTTVPLISSNTVPCSVGNTVPLIDVSPATHLSDNSATDKVDNTTTHVTSKSPRYYSKTKGKKFYFSEYQSNFLNEFFAKDQHPDDASIAKIAFELKVNKKRVDTWFKNTRNRKLPRNKYKKHSLKTPQIMFLKECFAKDPNPDDAGIARIAAELNVIEKRVKQWFINTQCRQVTNAVEKEVRVSDAEDKSNMEDAKIENAGSLSCERKRRGFSDEQRTFLDEKFSINVNPSFTELEEMASELNEDVDKVKNWFARTRQMLPDNQKRRQFDHSQKIILEGRFLINNSPNVEEMTEIADFLNVDKSRIFVWFAEKRRNIKYGRIKPGKVLMLTTAQREMLQEEFSVNVFPTSEQYVEISQRIGANVHRVRTWFEKERVVQGKTRSLKYFTDAQRVILKEYFAKDNFADLTSVEEIAQKIGDTVSRVKVWFGHERQSKESKSEIERLIRGAGIEQSTEMNIDEKAQMTKKLSEAQTAILLESFSLNPHPSASQLEEIARNLDADLTKVKVWFQNRRHKNKIRLKKNKSKFFSEDQKKVLKERFALNSHPSDEECLEIASEIGENLKRVRKWFKNEVFRQARDLSGFQIKIETETDETDLYPLPEREDDNDASQSGEPAQIDNQSGYHIEIDTDDSASIVGMPPLNTQFPVLSSALMTGNKTNLGQPSTANMGIKSPQEEKRHKYTEAERNFLLQNYATNNYPDLSEIKKIASEMNIKETSVKFWFIKHRKKSKWKMPNTPVRPATKTPSNTSPSPSTSPSPRNFSAQQVQYLRSKYEMNKYPDMKEIADIAGLMGVTAKKVRIWFYDERGRRKERNPTAFRKSPSGMSLMSPQVKSEPESYSQLLLPDKDVQTKLTSFLKNRPTSQLSDDMEQQGSKTENNKVSSSGDNKLTSPGTRDGPVFSGTKSEYLRNAYAVNKYPSSAEMHAMASRLGVEYPKIKTWFQNTRFKERYPNNNKVSGSGFSAAQIDYLKSAFASNTKPHWRELEKIGHQLGVTSKKVRLWFVKQRLLQPNVSPQCTPRSTSKTFRNFQETEEEKVLKEKTIGTHGNQIKFSEEQRQYLYDVFATNRYPSGTQQKEIAAHLGVHYIKVRQWFWQHRYNEKKGLKGFHRKGYLSSKVSDSGKFKIGSLLGKSYTKLMQRPEPAQDPSSIQVKQEPVDEKEVLERNNLSDNIQVNPLTESNTSAEKSRKFWQFTETQRGYLRSMFAVNRHPDSTQLDQMAQHLGVTFVKTKQWFLSERMRRKLNEKTEETSNVDVKVFPHSQASSGKVEVTADNVISGKVHRSPKRVYSPEEVAFLRGIFAVNKYPDPGTVKGMAEHLGVNVTKINQWLWRERWLDKNGKKKTKVSSGIFERKSLKSENVQKSDSKRYDFSEEQKKILKMRFALNNQPSMEDFVEISCRIGVSLNRVKKWFENEYYRVARQKGASSLKTKSQASSQDDGSNEVQSPEPGVPYEGRLSTAQRTYLKNIYAVNKYPDKEMMEGMARHLGVTFIRVKRWFSWERYYTKTKRGSCASEVTSEVTSEVNSEPEGEWYPGEQSHVEGNEKNVVEMKDLSSSSCLSQVAEIKPAQGLDMAESPFSGSGEFCSFFLFFSLNFLAYY